MRTSNNNNDKTPKLTSPISLDFHNAASCEQLETIRPPNRPLLFLSATGHHQNPNPTEPKINSELRRDCEQSEIVPTFFTSIERVEEVGKRKRADKRTDFWPVRSGSCKLTGLNRKEPSNSTEANPDFYPIDPVR
ncbi:hypothetical protein H5410_063163 [Solanum commersonii]|uniref:Uncharacterized protein n=1 Tax=Solanum commersonii TaxID=4109 RepID=A0A9J5WD08_SOLCO|nr:hypothetical protein H5410_063163 [Solanum commersonii]